MDNLVYFSILLLRPIPQTVSDQDSKEVFTKFQFIILNNLCNNKKVHQKHIDRNFKVQYFGASFSGITEKDEPRKSCLLGKL